MHLPYVMYACAALEAPEANPSLLNPLSHGSNYIYIMIKQKGVL